MLHSRPALQSVGWSSGPSVSLDDVFADPVRNAAAINGYLWACMVHRNHMAGSGPDGWLAPRCTGIPDMPPPRRWPAFVPVKVVPDDGTAAVVYSLLPPEGADPRALLSLHEVVGVMADTMHAVAQGEFCRGHHEQLLLQGVLHLVAAAMGSVRRTPEAWSAMGAGSVFLVDVILEADSPDSLFVMERAGCNLAALTVVGANGRERRAALCAALCARAWKCAEVLHARRVAAGAIWPKVNCRLQGLVAEDVHRLYGAFGVCTFENCAPDSSSPDVLAAITAVHRSETTMSSRWTWIAAVAKLQLPATAALQWFGFEEGGGLFGLLRPAVVSARV